MARDCATCRHHVRHRGREVCTRTLSLMTGEQLGRLHQWLARAPECWQERSLGRYVSLVFRECGKDGRYWRARVPVRYDRDGVASVSAKDAWESYRNE